MSRSKTIDRMNLQEVRYSLAILQAGWDSLTPEEQDQRSPLVMGLNIRLEQLTKEQPR
jgi:hypothetical protein